MRHRVKGRKLGRTASHRLATLRALATSLFRHKKIKTTTAKAKAAKMFIEPLITKAKEDSVHAKRYVSRHIKDRAVVQELFNVIVPKIGDRPGGYLRAVKLGQRLGDAADMSILELVDFNDILANKKSSKSKVKEEAPAETETAEVAEEVKDEDVQEAEVIEETTESEEVKSEETVETKAEEVKTEEKAEEPKEDSEKEEK